MQKHPNIDTTLGAQHELFTVLLEARGYQWAPLTETHIGYAGPEEDVACEVIETSGDKTVVLTFGETSWLLGYQGADDVPSIFAPTATGVELALRWVGAL